MQREKSRQNSGYVRQQMIMQYRSLVEKKEHNKIRGILANSQHLSHLNLELSHEPNTFLTALELVGGVKLERVE
jgi:hypothetical protein